MSYVARVQSGISLEIDQYKNIASHSVSYSNDSKSGDCGARQTMEHLLVCELMESACFAFDLTITNDIAIKCAKYWEKVL